MSKPKKAASPSREITFVTIGLERDKLNFVLKLTDDQGRPAGLNPDEDITLHDVVSVLAEIGVRINIKTLEITKLHRKRTAVNGWCKQCGRPVPSGFLECDGEGSHPVAPKPHGQPGHDHLDCI